MKAPSAPSPSAARSLPPWRKLLQVTINWIVLGVFVLGVAVFLRSRAAQKAAPTQEAEAPPAKLSDKAPDTLELPRHTVEAMRVQFEAVHPAPATAPLKLFGSLYLEGSRLVHVQTRFTGQVVEVGEVKDETGQLRALKPGDEVSKGQVLAKLWSKEVGEKKSDLVDAISKLYLHDSVLKRLHSLAGGTVPSARLQEAERDFAADKIEIERLKRTLRSWQIHEDELAVIQAEAERIIEESLAKFKPTDGLPQPPVPRPAESLNPALGRPSQQLALDRTWAELDILSPMDGVILEKNFTVGDIIDTSHDMFKVADLSRLGVMANVYEEDLPKLVALTPEKRRWEIELQAEPGLKPRQGQFESIGNVIDPMQHTAIVKGWLDNPDGQLRVGQFVTVTVNLPNPEGLVRVPTSSLVDDGSRAFVFVVYGNDKTTFTRREVRIARRGAIMSLIDSLPDKSTGSEANPQPLRADELVVSSGAVELAGQLRVLETQNSSVAVETPTSLEGRP